MSNFIGKAFLAAVIGLGTLAAIPVNASADEIFVVHDRWNRGWHNGYERRYEHRPRYERYDAPRFGFYERPWRRHHQMRCWENRWGRLICER
ncbi:hypothetical protein ABID16_000003 [Rhizobium aquaticum]|uniref:Uncharacterized protein n=1 Tax=Rhizobium aquaticum TaxID=1549636 RepID=A0ABV2IT81_9HYPH